MLGDAELDEGNLWEAVIEPQTRDLGNVLWVVDLNRQSLDRVVPIIKSAELQQQFATCGWQVLELKYGHRLRAAYARDGGDILRRRIDEMPNQLYQSLFGASEEVVHEALLRDLSPGDRARLAALLEEYHGHEGVLIQDLGGHDLADLLGAYESARRDTSRPTVLFAYTIKGWGLPMAGHPMNHSALLSGEQIDELRESFGVAESTEWDAFAEGTPEAGICLQARERLTRTERPAPAVISVPTSISTRDPASSSTQAAVGRTLLDLSRIDELAERIVTVSPDVSVSTNLGGWINKVGVYGHEEDLAYEEVEDSVLSWRVGPSGQHIELGISEMNLFLALGQLGMTQCLPARARSSRSARCMTRSSSGASRACSTARTPARGSSCWVPPLAYPSRAKVARTSRRSHQAWAWSCPVCSTPSPATRASSNGSCSTSCVRCRSPTESRSTCG